MYEPGTISYAGGNIPFGNGALTLCVNDQMGYICENEKIREELERQDFTSIVNLARQGVKQGINVFNIQLMHPEVDEKKLFLPILEEVLEKVGCCIAVDSRDVNIIDKALARYPYKAMCNCINGEKQNLDLFLPIIAKHGGAVGTALVDEKGIPETVEERMLVGRKILEAAQANGIPREDVILDAVCLPIGVMPDSMRVTLETIKAFKEELGVPVLLGISNASYMMPKPDPIDLTYFISAVSWGLDVAMVNPLTEYLDWGRRAADLLNGNDYYAKEYLRFYRSHNNNKQEE